MSLFRLGDYTDIKTGKLDVNAENPAGKYPFFTCSKNHTYIDEYAFEGENVLVAGNGDLNVKYYNGRFNAYQRTYVIQTKNTLDTKYLYYFLENHLEKLRGQAIGGVIKYIKIGNLTEAEIPLPPLEQQQKIAAILDAADELRQKDKALVAKYDELTQALFLDMFGDLVGNRKHPIVTIKELVEFVKDGPHVSPKYSESGIPILSTRNIRPFELINNDIKYVSRETYNDLTKRFKPQKNDVLLTKGGTTGYAKMVDWDWEFCVWVHLAVLRVNQKVLPKYLESALNTTYCYSQSQEYTRGIANKDLGLLRLINIQLPLPTIQLQNQYAERVKVIEEQKRISQASLLKSEELFNSLLQKAFNGELL
jgi:type I restriction enzyme S subunit